jgi:hypothetical protein
MGHSAEIVTHSASFREAALPQRRRTLEADEFQSVLETALDHEPSANHFSLKKTYATIPFRSEVK